MITIDDEIACVRREIAMRQRVYPAWVAKGKMKQEKADHEIAAMRAVLIRLEEAANRVLLFRMEMPYKPSEPTH
jgi:hypothetical protein